jgi:GT2 family glycosyltransferase
MTALDRLTFNHIVPPALEVVVIDNDINGSACKFCEEIKSEFKWSLKFGIESQRGISYARNRAIASASTETDFIVMIDDDEVPEPQWLEQLLLVQQKYHADVVGGPVLPLFPEDVPNWVKQGKFFDSPRYTTGESIEVAFNGNVLVRGEILRKLDKPFDERFALTGGEDSYFVKNLDRTGHKSAIAYSQASNIRKIC